MALAVAEAEGLAVAGELALAGGVALAEDGALAVGLADASSPVGLSSKARSPPRSSPPRSSPEGLSSWAKAAGASTIAPMATIRATIKILRIVFLSMRFGCMAIPT